MLVVGLDAASQWENFGFAIGRLGGGAVAIEQAGLVATRGGPEGLASIIAPLLRANDQALVAIDAPLGWPAPLGTSLANHRAGEKLRAEKNETFCRETDRWVRRQIGKKRLDVGADKIALAAYTALEALNILRNLSGKPIPLAWTTQFPGIAAIDVNGRPGVTRVRCPTTTTRKSGNYRFGLFLLANSLATIRLLFEQKCGQLWTSVHN